MINKLSKYGTKNMAFLAALAGIAVFALLLDPSIVNPFRVNWLANGDPAQSYLTWLFFRHEPWYWPLGVTHAMGMEQASSVVFSDSIPLLAIAFKMVNSWLPETFQYDGLWLCACYAMQAYFSYRLLALFTDRRFVLAIGVLLFLFSPIMLFRAQWHLALTAHWLILAALYLYYAPLERRRIMHWLVLLWLAPLVHAYLMLMVYAIWAAYLLRYGWLDRRWSIARLATLAAASIAGSLLMMWSAGYFLDMDVSSGGFGYYSMNLLAPFSRIGAGPALPHSPAGATSGQYEGFNYLGMGILLALLLGCLRSSSVLRSRGYGALKNWRQAPDLALILSCIPLCVLAISNEVTFGSHVLLVLPIPEKFKSAVNIFRASGRLFWPVYYLLMLAAIRSVLRFSSPTCARIMVIIFVIQMVDLFPFFQAVNASSTANAAQAKFPVFPSLFWRQARLRYSSLYVIPGQFNDTEHVTFESLAGAYGLPIDTAYYARLPALALQEPRLRRHEQFFEGVLDPHGLYLIQSVALDKLKSVQRLFPPTTGMGVVDGFTVVAPEWLNGAPGKYLHAPDKHDFPDVQTGETYLLGAGGNGAPYLLAGWSNPGDGGTWSDGSSAVLALHLPSGAGDAKIVLNVEPYLPIRFPHLEVDVRMNGYAVARWRFERGEPAPGTTLVVPKALRKADGNIALNFNFDAARSPLQSGESVDARRLALLIHSIRVSQE